MTQSAMRMNMAGSRPNQQDAQKRSDQQSSQKRSNQQSSTARSANTPSDVIANAASQTKDEKRGVFASMKQAMAPYVEGHSHTVLYGIVGFVIAALILHRRLLADRAAGAVRRRRRGHRALPRR